VHVRKDRRNGARAAGRFGRPCGRLKMFDEKLIHPLIGGENLSCGPTELSVNLLLTSGHAFCSLPHDIVRVADNRN
jgi:hypothetical protein